jgi:hypothetical protein
MQTDPTARHSPIGSFQRVCYLVHLARDGRMAAAPGTRPPALHPDRRRARWEGQTEVAVDLSGVGRFPKAFGAKLARRATRQRQRRRHPARHNWPSLRKAFTRHGLGMPAPNPEAVRKRAIAATRQRSRQPATPSLDPVFVALNPGALPARPRSPAELYQWVRRDEQYATLGASVVVELYSESHARKPATRAWAIIRRADRSHRLAGQRASRSERRHTDRADRTTRPQQPREREVAADTR